MIKIFIFIFFLSVQLLAVEYGTFVVVKGRVFIESVDSKTKAEAKIGFKIQVGETIISEADSKAKVVMSDRNILNILPNTKLKIEKYTNATDNKNVSLKLFEGKVRSKVEQKYDMKSSKFEIHTATAVAGVRGTEFITSYDPVTKNTEILTLKGQVSLRGSVVSTEKETNNVNNENSTTKDTNNGNGEKSNTKDTNSGNNESNTTKEVLVSAGEKSQVAANTAASEPIKLTKNELQQIDQESIVKKEKKNTEETTKTKKDEKNGAKQEDSKEPATNPESSETTTNSNESPSTSDNSAPKEPAPKEPAPPTLKPPAAFTPPVLPPRNLPKFDKSKIKIIIQK